MDRLPGWEHRLAVVLKAARNEPYELGRHDCFRVACAAVQALTGFDYWQWWAGTYHTRSQALLAMVRYVGDGATDEQIARPIDPRAVFTAAFTRLFGTYPVPVPQLHRGDIAEFVDLQNEAHLGVVAGASVMVLGESGLIAVRRDTCRHGWRIG